MKLNLELLLPLLATSLVTIIGWYILHQLSKKRDSKNKKQELRISYLIEAWKKLEYAANRKIFDKIEFIEKPIADIQLFGNKKQIELAQKIADEIATSGQCTLNELLIELRGDLREELNMEKVPNKIRHLRFASPEKNPS
jgi:hypothetical protein